MKSVYIIILVGLLSLPYVMAAVTTGTYDTTIGSTINGVTLTSTDATLNKCSINYKEGPDSYIITQGSTQTMSDGTTIKTIDVTQTSCELDIYPTTGGSSDVISTGSIINGIYVISSDITTNSCSFEYQGVPYYNIIQGSIETMADGIIIRVDDVASDNCKLNIGVASEEPAIIPDVGVCLYSSEGVCLLEENRFLWDTRGLINLSENTGISSILGNQVGNQVTWRNFLDFLNLKSGTGAYSINSVCLGARVCDNDEESRRLRCSAVKNNICPEDYGDWSGCEDNEFGGKCTPCDPDCGDDEDPCGRDLSIVVPNVKYSSGGWNIPITVRCESYGYENIGNYNEGRFTLYKIEIEEIGGDLMGWVWYPIEEAEVDCNLVNDNIRGEYYLCANDFHTTVNKLGLFFNHSVVPCESYRFACGFEYKENESEPYLYVSMVSYKGIASPYITITNPEDGNSIQETETLSANVQCSAPGVVASFNFDLYDENNIHEIDHSLGHGEGEYSYNLNTRNYQNGNYILDATTIGTNDGKSEPYTASIEITIDNPPEEQEFKILNVVLAKIKTWL